MAFGDNSVIELIDIGDVEDFVYSQLLENSYYITWLMMWLKMYDEKNNKFIILSNGIWSNFKVNEKNLD
jgi:hypothetical protein